MSTNAIASAIAKQGKMYSLISLPTIWGWMPSRGTEDSGVVLFSL